MEGVAFAFTVAGLPAALNGCLQWFEYVQVGRNFGEDFAKCLLRLELAKLNLCMWSHAIGLSKDSVPEAKIQIPGDDYHSAEKTRKLIELTLEAVQNCFENAAKLSDRYKLKNNEEGTDSTAVVPYNPEIDLESSPRRVYQKLRKSSDRLQGGFKIPKRARWALYDKKKFDRLIDDINGFINELTGLFPEQVEEQKRLCSAEFRETENDEDLRLLQGVIEDDDEILKKAVNDELKARGHNVSEWILNDGAQHRVGDDNAMGVEGKGHHIGKIVCSGTSKGWLGNRNIGEQGSWC